MLFQTFPSMVQQEISLGMYEISVYLKIGIGKQFETYVKEILINWYKISHTIMYGLE